MVHSQIQEALVFLACRGQNRSVANTRWPTSSLAHLTPSRPPALFAATKAARPSPRRCASWRGLGTAPDLLGVAPRTTARRASGKMLTGATQLWLSLACPLHLGRTGRSALMGPTWSAFLDPPFLPLTGTVRITRRHGALSCLPAACVPAALLAPCRCHRRTVPGHTVAPRADPAVRTHTPLGGRPRFRTQSLYLTSHLITPRPTPVRLQQILAQLGPLLHVLARPNPLPPPRQSGHP